MSFIFDPRKERLNTLGLSRRIDSHLEILDTVLKLHGRDWCIQGAYAPIQATEENPLPRGLRILLEDTEKGFYTMMWQSEMEVLLGFGQPGQLCGWQNALYPEPGGSSWRGPHIDQETLLDLIYDLETEVRVDLNQTSPRLRPVKVGTRIQLRIHMKEGADWFWSFECIEDVGPTERVHPVDAGLRWKKMPAPHSRQVAWAQL